MSVQDQLKYGFSFLWGRKNNSQLMAHGNVSQQTTGSQAPPSQCSYELVCVAAKAVVQSLIK